MEKLSNDEMMIIMLEMKKKYEEEYKILETKFGALTNYCKDGIIDDDDDITYCHTLMKSDQCVFCEKYVYEVKVKPHNCDCDNTEECVHQFISDSYRPCYGCGIVFCDECLYNECIIEYIPNPSPNKFWCKECYKE